MSDNDKKKPNPRKRSDEQTGGFFMLPRKEDAHRGLIRLQPTSYTMTRIKGKLQRLPDIFKTDEHTPQGFYRLTDVEIYYNPTTDELIIEGSPQTPNTELVEDAKGNLQVVSEYEPKEEDLLNHSCDIMGCGSTHVLIRTKVNKRGF